MSVLDGKLRLLVVDDHSGVRMGLKTLLENESTLFLAGEAVDGVDAVHKYRELRPDVVLMDVNLPRMGGAQATERIRSEFPDACIVAWSVSDREEDLRSALVAGARAYVLKTAERSELIGAILAAVQRGPESAPSETSCPDTKVSGTNLPSCN